MSFITYINNVKKNWKTAMSIMLLVVIVVFAVSVALPAKYRATSTLLVVPKHDISMDVYTAAKSTEFISRVLTELVYSRSFYETVRQTDTALEPVTTSQDPEKIQKAWGKTVDTNIVSNTGVIKISVYHEDKMQAYKYAYAVSGILTQNNEAYLGGGYADVRTIDTPITSKNPVSPNVLVNTLLAVIIGGFLGLSVIYLFPEFNLFPKKEKIKNIEIPHIDNGGMHVVQEETQDMR